MVVSPKIVFCLEGLKCFNVLFLPKTCLNISLTLYVGQTKTNNYANSVEPAEMAHNEPSPGYTLFAIWF